MVEVVETIQKLHGITAGLFLFVSDLYYDYIRGRCKIGHQKVHTRQTEEAFRTLC